MTYKTQAGIKLYFSNRILQSNLLSVVYKNICFGELSILANAVSNLEIISPISDIYSVDFGIWTKHLLQSKQRNRPFHLWFTLMKSSCLATHLQSIMNVVLEDCKVFCTLERGKVRWIVFEYRKQNKTKRLLRMQWSSVHTAAQLCTDSLDSEVTSKSNRAWATSPASSVPNMFCHLCVMSLWTLESTMQRPDFRASMDSVHLNSCLVALMTMGCVSTISKSPPRSGRASYLVAMLHNVPNDTFLGLGTA